MFFNRCLESLVFLEIIECMLVSGGFCGVVFVFIRVKFFFLVYFYDLLFVLLYIVWFLNLYCDRNYLLMYSF